MSAIQSLQLFYPVAGFFVGLLVGLTGVGGGSLMTPILILLFGVHPASAVGTDLLYAAATKTAGSLVHGYNRTVDWRVVRHLAAGSVPADGADHLGAELHQSQRCDGARARSSGVLTVALFATALTLVFRDRIIARYAAHLSKLSSRQVDVLTVIVGAVLGVLVSISSVGAGAIGVTALILLYPRLPMARVVGSDIAHAVPLTLVAGIGHWWLGSIDLDLLVPLLLGSVPGIVLGSYTVAHVPEKALRLLLAATLVLVATKLSLDTHSASASVVTATTNRAH